MSRSQSHHEHRVYYVKEEKEREKRDAEKRRQRIVKVVLDNLDEPDFTFDALCERFSQDMPYTLRTILKDSGILWDGTAYRWIRRLAGVYRMNGHV